MAERPRDAYCTSFMIDVERYAQNGKIAFLSHPLGDIRGMRRLFILGLY